MTQIKMGNGVDRDLGRWKWPRHPQPRSAFSLDETLLRVRDGMIEWKPVEMSDSAFGWVGTDGLIWNSHGMEWCLKNGAEPLGPTAKEMAVYWGWREEKPKRGALGPCPHPTRLFWTILASCPFYCLAFSAFGWPAVVPIYLHLALTLWSHRDH